MQLKPECRHNPEDTSTFGITTRRERLIETLATQSSFTCNLCDAFCASDIISRSSCQHWISIL